jgi:(p)ppGpp synthase/HD superfamily hydrolase
LTYSERFEEALRYAARLHRAQMRKGTNIPYVTHLLAVAAIVGGSRCDVTVFSGSRRELG